MSFAGDGDLLSHISMQFETLHGAPSMSDPKCGQTRPDYRGFDPQAVAVFLRRRHPRDTAGWVASTSGVKFETARNWLRGRAAPNALHLLALAGAYGPEFLTACWPAAPAWLDAAARGEAARQTRADIAALHARLEAIEEPRGEERASATGNVSRGEEG